MSKTCNTCHESLPLDRFHKRAASRDGLNHKCKACNSAKAKQWREDNPERAAKLDHDKYVRNSDKYKARAKAWGKANPAYAKAKRHDLRQATFGDMKDIEYVYHAAEVIKSVYGGRPDVDHIVPSKGKDVCGLHASWNLQLMNPSKNRSKSNRF